MTSRGPYNHHTAQRARDERMLFMRNKGCTNGEIAMAYDTTHQRVTAALRRLAHQLDAETQLRLHYAAQTRPCPFCRHSGTRLVWHANLRGPWAALCTNCDAQGPGSTSAEAAIKAWNRRTRAIQVAQGTQVGPTEP